MCAFALIDYHPGETRYGVWKGARAMKVSMGNNRAQRWISAGFAMVTPGRAVKVVASGVLLAAAMVMYFNLASESTAGSPPLLGATPAAPAPQPQRFFGAVEEELPVAPDDGAGLIRHMADHLGVSPQAVKTFGTDFFRDRPEEELALSPDQEASLRRLDIQRRQARRHDPG
jgi:hypothetical protein